MFRKIFLFFRLLRPILRAEFLPHLSCFQHKYFKTKIIWLASNCRRFRARWLISYEFRVAGIRETPFVQCMQSFVSGRDSLRETIFEMASGQNPRILDSLTRYWKIARIGMHVRSNGRNSSRSSQPAERETMLVARWKIAKNELPCSFKIG